MRLLYVSIRMLLVVLLTGGVFVVQVYAQTAEELLKQVDQLDRSFKEDEAYAKCKEALMIQPENLLALIKCSDLAARIGVRQPNKDGQKDVYSAGRIYAERALKVDSNSSEANCAMAMVQGRLSLLESGKQKVALVKEVKNYVDKALGLDKNNSKAWHVLGEWYFEVSNLSGFEKVSAKVLFGGMPKASLDDAIGAFEKSRSLNASFLLNYYELARCYKASDQNDKAIAVLQLLLRLPRKLQDDDHLKADGKVMLDGLM